MKNHTLPGIRFFHLDDNLMDRTLVPYFRNTAIKNKKLRLVFRSYVVGNTAKILIPPCGVLDSEIQTEGDLLYEKQYIQIGFNRYLWSFCLILICLFVTTFSSAATGDYTLQIDFSFDIQAVPGKQVTGYRLYRENDMACDAGGVDPQSITCTINAEPGSYNFTLAALYDDNSESPQSPPFVFTLTEPVIPPPEPDVPPTAVISSSTSVGDAPLVVQFDGSSSSTMQPPVTSYVWNFGDGNSATGAVTSHTFLIPGTYQTILTVTDSAGLTDQTSTPVIITSAPVEENQPPVSSFAVTPTSGTTPLTVLFDASSSSDPDGSITGYLWNFGDGSTATGISSQHTFIEVADYTVSLQVTDDKGEAAVSSKIISVLGEEETNFYFELGEVEVDHNWITFTFSRPFSDPVVIAGPPSSFDAAPATVRIRNVNQNGFETRIQEWDYLVDNHAPETFSFMVMEKGVFTLADGTRVEAGSFIGSTRFQNLTMQQPYQVSPVILTQVMTENEVDAVTGRIQNIDQTSFEYKLQEQEKTKNRHITETIGYIAWEPGKGEFAGLFYETGLTTGIVTDEWFDLSFQTEFPDLPLCIAGMQTYADADTAALRAENISRTSVLIKTEEEQSKTTETSHNPEVVGYITISAAAAAGE